MFNKWSITWRLSILLLVGVGSVLIGLTGYSYFSVKRMLEEELMDKARHIAMTVTTRIETSARPVEGVAQGLAGVLETVPISEEQSYRVLEQLINRNADVFGAAIALEPAEGGNKHNAVPYVYRTDGGLQKTDLGQGAYHYEINDWYVLPKEMKQPVWSEPYFDEGGGNILMATYAVPVLNSPGEQGVRGVVTGDMSLASLSELLAALELGRSNYAFIISGQGRFIAHPTDAFIMRESIFSVAEERKDSMLRDLGQKMIRGQSGYAIYTSEVSGKAGWVVYMPISSTGWSLGIFFSRDELMARVFELNRIQWYLGIAGFLLLCTVVMGISRSITKPIRQLEKATRKLASGDLNAPIPSIPGNDEVARLSESFTIMISELKVYMEILKETAATKERIESELRIAHSIQMGLVPKTFPAFPDRKELQLFALLDPAREVGGDFYDFFFLDEANETLCMVIGDVSDKGIGAALFMAVTRTLLRSMARENQEPTVILSRLNDELSRDNESCMFVTLFCAAVHLPSGQCTYACAGHCPPVVIKPDGNLLRLTEAKGPVAGGMEGMLYTKGSHHFMPGDVLFLYTDGVTEAANREKELFGEERMNRELALLRTCATEELLRSLRDRLRDFADDAEQSDDITMLVFRYNGNKGDAE